jgi:hypothetical protein
MVRISVRFEYRMYMAGSDMSRNQHPSSSEAGLFDAIQRSCSPSFV